MADDFTITGQTQTVGMGPDRRFRDELEVTYKVRGTNVTGTVTIPLDEATPEHVAEEVQRRVDLHNGIAQL